MPPGDAIVEALTRQWTMLRSIPRWPRTINAPSLQARLDDLGYPTTLRTIQRDLVKLSAVFPLGSEDGKPAVWFWPKNTPVFDTPGMDPMTALTFSLAETFLTRMLPQSAVAHLKPHFRAANGVLKETRKGAASSWPKKIGVTSRSFSLMPPRVPAYILNKTYDALLHNRRFAAKYLKPYPLSMEEYEVNPLGLVFADEIIYLICTLFDHEAPVRLALHRFYEITPSDKAARTPKGFKIEEFLRDKPLEIKLGEGPIKLRVIFDQQTAFHLMETRLSTDQRIEDLPDGRVLVTASVQDSAQLHWWLLGLGTHVEVVGPKTLRDEIATTVRTLSKRYE